MSAAGFIESKHGSANWMWCSTGQDLWELIQGLWEEDDPEPAKKWTALMASYINVYMAVSERRARWNERAGSIYCMAVARAVAKWSPLHCDPPEDLHNTAMALASFELDPL